jgi:predicted ATPase
MLGFCFDEEMITEVKASIFAHLSGNYRNDEAYSMAISSVSTTLDEALKGGFIESCKSGYQFSHDKLQAAFQTMLNENEASQLHGIIADIYADRGDPESIYHAVNHLKHCKEAIENNKERVKHAEMYLTAANFCKDRSAFIQASELLSLGLDFPDNNNKWESHFDLTFEMTKKLAKAELIIGNFESCWSLALVVLDHAKTKEMKVNALVTYVECFMAQNDVHASTKASKQAL